MSTPTDQSTECSQENMGAEDSKNNSAESELNHINKIAGFDYLIQALKKCSEETREEILDKLDETHMEKTGDDK